MIPGRGKGQHRYPEDYMVLLSIFIPVLYGKDELLSLSYSNNVQMFHSKNIFTE